ncbi:MAG: protein-L-isoaspartate(D-aspartate) O-methyltransferase [Prolixibacteraceae bacterium]|nr:protein-L-isoaspartate(D-aspartate) O-methyltransferase [Prolixibacteraceae bacterium]MBN2773008.1 protein-L-isoaspartate(D-aspartate) O-methyltransferase [Prolixibacteraceae bacterium]
MGAIWQQKEKFQIQKEKMIQQQLKSRGISDRKVLDAFLEVERHKFVLPEYREQAYGDFPLMIKEGQTISQPYVVAFMTEQLALEKDDKVLEIGTGSGYQAAILAQLCDSVFTVEIFETLANDAKTLFQELGYNNIFVKHGDGYLGWPEHAPYDAIIVTCSPKHIPEPLKEQLAERGKMIIPVGTGFAQNLVLLEKKKGKIRQRNVLPVRFVPMINEQGKSY